MTDSVILSKFNWLLEHLGISRRPNHFLPPANIEVSNELKQAIDDFLIESTPAKNTPLHLSSLVAIDFETTGLNAKTDSIISMGFCPVDHSKIQLSKGVHLVVNSPALLTKENVALHGITDDVVKQGITPEQALITFLNLSKGKVIVAHHHSIEKLFIQALAKKLLGIKLPLVFIDTLTIAERRKKRRDQSIAQGELRLFNLRKELGLPNYNAHNALEDAISTAELLLAQIADLNMPLEKIKLKQLGFFRH